MKGLLLVNLGTPDSPSTKDVRRYLAEFLSDPRVIDIGAAQRWLLLHGIILRFRPRKSAEAYQQIWTERGSPLLFHTEDLRDRVRDILGNDWRVEVAMRYGNPSIASGLEAFRHQGIDDIVVFPLYPQYASSSTGSTVEEALRQTGSYWNVPAIATVPAFYDDDGFIESFRIVGAPILEQNQPDHILFSFHGLPERHVQKSDDTGTTCLVKPDCCARITAANRSCYRAQCFATARKLASALELADDSWTITFQSRLGRTKWIEPYTDEVLVDLAKRGIKRLAIFCPAFVADCLETLEEIRLRAKESFLEAGGEDLVLVPSLNSSDHWAHTVARLALRANQPAKGETQAPSSAGKLTA